MYELILRDIEGKVAAFLATDGAWSACYIEDKPMQFASFAEATQYNETVLSGDGEVAPS